MKNENEAIKIKCEIDILKAQINENWSKVNILEDKLIKICPHNHVKSETKYIEGSYLNVSYYEHTVRCVICNEILDTKQESTNSYP